MHEMSIAQSILDVALDEATRASLERIEAVRVRVGAMSGVVPDSLKFCWELLVAEEGLAQGALLVVETVPIGALCKKCLAEFEIENYAFECPNCGAGEIEVVSGRELTVANITGE